MDGLRKRESGIELLKIFAMLMIVINHVTQTIVDTNIHFEPSYVYPIGEATTNAIPLVLSYLRTFGGQGNIIFLACSAWFLVDSKGLKVQKIFGIIFDAWIISIMFLCAVYFASGVPIDSVDIIKSLFPITFGNNWYITCYLLLYAMHTFLNKIIDSCSQKALLTICLVTLLLYFGIDFISLKDYFFASNIIYFVVVYFVIAYIKKYMPELCKNRKYNLMLLAVGLLGTLSVLLVPNYLGVHFSMLEGLIGKWFISFSPFYLITAVALLNLFKSVKFTNSAINYISGLSLIVYIAHENLLFRLYCRPAFCIMLEKSNLYSNHIILFDLLFSIALFAAAMLFACLYKAILQPTVQRVGAKISNRLLHIFDKLEDMIIMIK